MRHGVTKVAVLGIVGAGLVTGGSTVAVAYAPTAKADFCSSGWVPTTAWSTCDYPLDVDGSHVRCDAVFVFGFGGTNCYRVYPPPPPDP